MGAGAARPATLGPCTLTLWCALAQTPPALTQCWERRGPISTDMQATLAQTRTSVPSLMLMCREQAMQTWAHNYWSTRGRTMPVPSALYDLLRAAGVDVTYMHPIEATFY